jgi:uncharacterized heparinase superfamily protein
LVRLSRQLRQKIKPPAWPALPALPAAGIAAHAAPTECGPSLADYFLQRPVPRFHFSHTELSDLVQTIPTDQQRQTITGASALLQGQHTYRGITASLGEDFDWQDVPVDSQDWQWDLNRHYWLLTLGRAWQYTRDEALGRQASRLLRDWMVHNPPDVQSPLWRPFEVATRLNNWIWGLYLLSDCPSFAGSALGYLWQGLIAHARYLYAQLERHVANNHLLVEAKTLAVLGLLFPELPQAGRWFQTGLATLWTQVRRQFHPDGVHSEQATQYHCLCTSELWELVHLLQQNDYAIPSDVLDRFAASVRFQNTILKPDGHIPLFGDSARHDLHIRFDARWALGGLDEARFPTGSPDEETRWLMGSMPGSDGADSLELAPTSQAFSQGGYVVMREADHCLVLDCGPFGDRLVPSHGHADALSFELCAFGQTLLTDSGGYSYHAPPVWRHYFRGTAAHNTVVVDQQDQSELVGKRLVQDPAQARLLQWCTTPVADWAIAEHDGYERLNPPVRHRRCVLFVKPHYWLLLDSLLGEGEHQLDWHFHLPPGAAVTQEPGSNALNASVDEVGLIIQTTPVPNLKTKIWKGETSPPRGWVSLESGYKSPAPEVTWTWEGPLPLHLPIALVPNRSTPLSPVTLHVSYGPQSATLALDTPWGHDQLGITLDPGVPAKMDLEGLQATAHVLMVRHPQQQPVEALAIGVQEISGIVQPGEDVGQNKPSVGATNWARFSQRNGQWHWVTQG